MKHLFTSLAVIATMAGAVGFVSFRTSVDPAVQEALTKHDPMEWLRADFQLTDPQFAAIKNLHDSYSLVCADHCREIQRAMRARNILKTAAQADPAAVAQADRRVDELRIVCESAIATHVRRCAAEMSPPAGQRYLAMMLPKIKDFDHMAPPDLQLNHGPH